MLTRAAATPPCETCCSSARRGLRSVLLAVSGVLVLHSSVSAQGWQRLHPDSLGVSLENRQMGFIVDAARRRLVMAGGEKSDGQTWALQLDDPRVWTSLNSPIPSETNGVVRAILDEPNQRMLMLDGGSLGHR